MSHTSSSTLVLVEMQFICVFEGRLVGYINLILLSVDLYYFILLRISKLKYLNGMQSLLHTLRLTAVKTRLLFLVLFRHRLQQQLHYV